MKEGRKAGEEELASAYPPLILTGSDQTVRGPGLQEPLT